MRIRNYVPHPAKLVLLSSRHRWMTIITARTTGWEESDRNPIVTSFLAHARRLSGIFTTDVCVLSAPSVTQRAHSSSPPAPCKRTHTQAHKQPQRVAAMAFRHQKACFPEKKRSRQAALVSPRWRCRCQSRRRARGYSPHSYYYRYARPATFTVLSERAERMSQRRRKARKWPPSS